MHMGPRESTSGGLLDSCGVGRRARGWGEEGAATNHDKQLGMESCCAKRINKMVCRNRITEISDQEQDWNGIMRSGHPFGHRIQGQDSTSRPKEGGQAWKEGRRRCPRSAHPPPGDRRRAVGGGGGIAATVWSPSWASSPDVPTCQKPSMQKQLKSCCVDNK